MNSNHPEMKFVPKKWGYELWIVNKKEYCGKKLFLLKNKKGSLHFHHVKDETFFISRGKVKILYEDVSKVREHLKYLGTRSMDDLLDSIILKEGDNFYIPPGRAHQIIALEDTEIFEFSTFHEDVDSIRLVKGD